MSRIFIDIHLRQWEVGKQSVKLRDLAGNIVTLDGLVHDRPHQFILIELPTDPKETGSAERIIDVPGWFTDYHPDNAHEIGAKTADGRVKRISHPLPKVKRHPKKGLVWAHNDEPVNAQAGASADAPLGVHTDVVPPS